MNKDNPLSRMARAIKNFFTGNVPVSEEERKVKKMGDMWFTEEIQKSKYKERITRVNTIDDYLRRQHSVLSRPDFEWKDKTFTTAKIILQTLKSVVKFHVSYICGIPVSITGDKDLVSVYNKIYKYSNYSKTDLQVAKDIVTYGDAFEYVYMDEVGQIKSKVIRNKDSYPIYDANGNYTHFVEYWKDDDSREDHYVVYYPDKVEVWKGNTLISTADNLTGLPIWYSELDKARYDKFGDAIINDLIPIMDAIENLMSKIDDAVTTLSLNPLGVVTGQRIDSAIPNSIVGTVLNLEEGSDFKYASADMDRDVIKMELDYLIQQFYAVACVPASIMGQSNVANVSETSITMLYQQTDNVARQYIVCLLEGFMQRLGYIRKLMELKGITVEDEDFESLSIEFNVNRPVDRQSDMENMKMQKEAGAMSIQTMIDKSPYTTDTALEMQRLEAERISGENLVPEMVESDEVEEDFTPVSDKVVVGKDIEQDEQNRS